MLKKKTVQKRREKIEIINVKQKIREKKRIGLEV